jgi:hypothetical protein
VLPFGTLRFGDLGLQSLRYRTVPDQRSAHGFIPRAPDAPDRVPRPTAHGPDVQHRHDRARSRRCWSRRATSPRHSSSDRWRPSPDETRHLGCSARGAARAGRCAAPEQLRKFRAGVCEAGEGPRGYPPAPPWALTPPAVPQRPAVPRRDAGRGRRPLTAVPSEPSSSLLAGGRPHARRCPPSAPGPPPVTSRTSPRPTSTTPPPCGGASRRRPLPRWEGDASWVGLSPRVSRPASSPEQRACGWTGVSSARRLVGDLDGTEGADQRDERRDPARPVSLQG